MPGSLYCHCQSPLMLLTQTIPTSTYQLSPAGQILTQYLSILVFRLLAFLAKIAMVRRLGNP